MTNKKEAPGFKLTGGDDTFSSKSKQMADLLGSLEKKHFSSENSWKTKDSQKDRSFKDDPKEEPVAHSSFKAPASRIRVPRGRRVPGFRKNPGKWTAYDLSDVKVDNKVDVSGVHSFMNELKERNATKRQAESEPEDLDNDKLNDVLSKQKEQFKRYKEKEQTLSEQKESNTHLFARPTSTVTSCEADTTLQEKAPRIIGSKLVMPEYVVGSKPQNKKEKKNRISSSAAASSNNSIGLGHLDVDDTEISSSQQISSSDMDTTVSSSASAEKKSLFKSTKNKKKVLRSRRADEDED